MFKHFVLERAWIDQEGLRKGEWSIYEGSFQPKTFYIKSAEGVVRGGGGNPETNIIGASNDSLWHVPPSGQVRRTMTNDPMAAAQANGWPNARQSQGSRPRSKSQAQRMERPRS